MRSFTQRRVPVIIAAAVFGVIGVTGAALAYANSGNGDAGLNAQGVPSGAPLDGCTLGETEELYVAKLYDCGASWRVYTFNTEEAKKNWLEIAKEFGTVPGSEGDLWLRVPRD